MHTITIDCASNMCGAEYKSDRPPVINASSRMVEFHDHDDGKRKTILLAFGDRLTVENE
jgi:hypothetical protein